jgi:hypothetical protein
MGKRKNEEASFGGRRRQILQIERSFSVEIRKSSGVEMYDEVDSAPTHTQSFSRHSHSIVRTSLTCAVVMRFWPNGSTSQLSSEEHQSVIVAQNTHVTHSF